MTRQKSFLNEIRGERGGEKKKMSRRRKGGGVEECGRWVEGKREVKGLGGGGDGGGGGDSSSEGRSILLWRDRELQE